jgi:hypothetical protein
MKDTQARDRAKLRKRIRKALVARGIPCEWRDGILQRTDRRRIASGIIAKKGVE